MTKSAKVIKICVFATIAIIGFAIGYRRANPPGSTTTSLISWNTDLPAALESATAAKKPVFIDFYADWCPPCRQMDKTTFQDYDVLFKLQNFETVKVDVDDNQELSKQFGVQALPTFVVVNPDGSRKYTRGYQSPQALISFLDESVIPE